MAFDPIALAEDIRRSYALNLVGTDQAALWRLLQRFGDLEISPEDKLGDLVKIKGPYLQALGIPRWSTQNWRAFGREIQATFAPHGLAQEIVDTFSEMGFRRLYEFQERGMQAVLDDRNALVVAATGRGKTESWLIPLFQYIIARKRDQIEDSTNKNGTKALLIYPTKALAQDQLKRLLSYLFRLNEKLEPTARISVGIYDGDTPNLVETDAAGYLRASFRYFRCPIYDESEAICRTCGQHLNVINDDDRGGRYTLAVPNPQCRRRAPLGFVHLVREDIVDGMPDIVLTNPDMLNLRLLNINADDERRFLIEQPKFIVLDEVHTYTELFGSFTSMIIKRLRQQRAELRTVRHGLVAVGDEPLRIIAASATVANDAELFTRLCNVPADEVQVVREESIQISVSPPARVPFALISERLSDEDLENALLLLAEGKEIPAGYQAVFNLFNLRQGDLPVRADGDDEVIRAAADLLFEILTINPARSPGLDVLRALHETLHDVPMTPTEVEEHLVFRYPELSTEERTNLTRNFGVLGAFSGLLENRVHLFAWPIDGYYVCLRCGHVYDSVRAECEQCGHDFVTKLMLCNECGEEALESWFCPSCRRLYPLTATAEGENVYYRGWTCDCTPEGTEALRIVWKPYYRCDVCGTGYRVSTGELSGSAPGSCPTGCGGFLEPIRDLPWICRNCGRAVFEEKAPSRCTCGGRVFALGALFDLDTGLHCEVCKGDFLEGHNPDHNAVPGGEYTEYKLLDGDWRIRKPKDFRTVVPCYHLRARYMKNSRYEKLMRSPANAAVTTAQFALRHVVGQAQDDKLRDQLQQAKLLCFSDSFSDMEQLAQDFDDPEKNTFLDQAVVQALEEGPCTLKELGDKTVVRLRDYGNLLRTPGDPTQSGYDWVNHFGGPNEVRGEIEGRFVAGSYPGTTTRAPWLVREGIADVWFDVDHLDVEERAILDALANYNNQRKEALHDMVADEVANFYNVLERLQMQGVVMISQRDYVSLSSERLVCALVGPDHPVEKETQRGRLRSTLETQLNAVDRPAEPFDRSYRDRIDPGQPDFSYYAYRIAHSRPVLLRSQVYKGDIPKIERRKIEYSFKYGADIHFLSSGPAMEMGIDIGDLDLLWLFGTPPNINNYLQRIGRAGRRSKRSLVLSVSKRNPIDFYYYRNPLDLMSSVPQPVPLNEHNHEVLRAALTWALLDFVADHYWIPWRRERTPDGQYFTDGQDFRSLLDPRPNDISALTTLLYVVPSKDLDYGAPLHTLATIIHDRRDLARSYLVRLLDYRVCNRCGSYVYDDVDACPKPGCQGGIEKAADHHLALIEDVLDHFAERTVTFLEAFRQDLRRQQRSANRELEEVEDAQEDRRLPPDRKRDLKNRATRLRDRVRAVSTAIDELDKMSFVRAQLFSDQARYAYNIRNISDTVEVLGYEETGGQVRARPRTARDIGMAIKEYHPYSVILTGRKKHLTRAVALDPWRTEDLRSRLEQAGLAAPPIVCTACGRSYTLASGPTCACGGLLLRAERVVMRRSEIQLLDLRICDDPDQPGRNIYPRDVFRLGADHQVSRTFAQTSSQVVSFIPTEELSLADDRGVILGNIAFGDLEVVTSTEGCSVVYEDGLREPRSQPLVVCGEEGCNGVIVQSRATRFCAIDPSHSPYQRRLLYPSYLFSTKGLRLQLPDQPNPATHALAHGLRMALEKLGGLSVRNINELLDGGNVYIFDAIPGGGGVTELLLRQEGGQYLNFAQALQTIDLVVRECSCAEGCPHCLYQYGCDDWNSPSGLSRMALLRLLDAGLTIGSATSSTDVLSTALPVPAWSSEESALRAIVWKLIGELELRLRTLLESRMLAQHGERWIERVPVEMRESWERAQGQDQQTFVQYGSTRSTILDYSYLSELKDLIAREWSLFNDVLGTGKEQKRSFLDRAQAVLRVRNPLAHNRAVPSNELKRAEVYATDLLLLLRSQDAV